MHTCYLDNLKTYLFMNNRFKISVLRRRRPSPPPSPAFTMFLFLTTVVAIAFLVRFYEKKTNAMCKSQKRLDGKTALVTGGTAGMGLKIATDFARRGARVIVACPFENEGIHGLKIIKEKSGNPNVIYKHLDLSSLESVRKFAAYVKENEDRLDILVNNAGVGVPRDFITKDGLSFIMQVNYFGHFLLTLLLLPLLKKSGTPDEPSRVVNTSSVLHQFGIIGFNNLNETNHFLITQIYSKSKFALVLFSIELTNRLVNSNVVVNSIDPGAVGTGIFNSMGIFGPLISFFFGSFFKTPFEGAQTALYVSLDEEPGKVSGRFFKNCRETSAVSWAYNDKLVKRLWEESVRLVKLTDEEFNESFKS